MGAPESVEYARGRVSAPALALLATSTLSFLLLMASLAFSVWLLVSGKSDELPAPRFLTKEAEVAIRIGANVLAQLLHFVVFVGALRMFRLRSRAWARAACVCALVPCCGPCLVLGIPFGVWGLVVLSDPAVQAAFESPDDRSDAG